MFFSIWTSFLRLKVYTEGKADRSLVICLGVKNGSVQTGRYKKGVLRRVAEESNVLGLVDQDPLTIQNYRKDMLDFQLIEKRHSIESYEHKCTGSQLIVLCPELESWIIKVSRVSKINISKYNLPSKASALHKIINSRIPNAEKLIQELVAQKNPSILYLQSLLLP